MGRSAEKLPIGYHTVQSGQASQLSETTGGLFALGIGILVAYMVLASQFNAFQHPITVLTILHHALYGAALGLFAGGKTLNTFGMIGVLLLMGIVKKNSILLVGCATQVSEHEGPDARAAMQKAGPLRLRPILMMTGPERVSGMRCGGGIRHGVDTLSRFSTPRAPSTYAYPPAGVTGRAERASARWRS